MADFVTEGAASCACLDGVNVGQTNYSAHRRMRSSAHGSRDSPAWTTMWILAGTRGHKRATIQSRRHGRQYSCAKTRPRGDNPRGKVETDGGRISAQVEFVPGGITGGGEREKPKSWLRVINDAARRGRWTAQGESERGSDQTVSMTNQWRVASAPNLTRPLIIGVQSNLCFAVNQRGWPTLRTRVHGAPHDVITVK